MNTRSLNARALSTRARPRAWVLVLAAVAAAGVLAPWVAPFDPARQLDVRALQNASPSLTHLLGTDSYSRDVLSRALFGARTSLIVAGGATGLAIVVALAAVCGMRALPAPVRTALMVLSDALRAIPRKLLVLAVLLPLPRPTPFGLAVVLGATSWMTLVPLLHTELARVAVEPFVESARAMGLSRWRIARAHMLPQLAGPLGALAALLMADLIAAEAALAFLGLGVRVPTSSWGGMLQDALPHLESAWWVALVPMTLVALTIGALSGVTHRTAGVAPTVTPRDSAER